MKTGNYGMMESRGMANRWRLHGRSCFNFDVYKVVHFNVGIEMGVCLF